MAKLKLFCILIVSLFAAFGCARLDNALVDTANSGRQTEYVLVKNSAAPDTVVFENGLGGKMDSWAKVLPEVSKNATVFAYNRPGYGASGAATTPRDGEHIVNELREFLAKKELKAPYILVWHSLGGLYMQYFARRYPSEVKALILVDSTHPKQFEGDGSPDKWSWLLRFGFDLALNSSQSEEFRLIDQTGDSVLALPPPTQTRVTILSALKPMSEKSKLADHANRLRKDIAALYPNSKQTWVDSGHVIPLERPESVILAIKEFFGQP